MSAFARGIVRDVRSSLGRFLAIMGIVALGCGFFAGLRMAGPDMRAAADAYYDETCLWDLRVVSTLGLGDDDLERLAQVEGVSAVAGSVSVDAMARVGSEQVAVRVASLPEAYERGEEPALNRLVLQDGRWPSAAGECVVSADEPTLSVAPGDTVEVLYEAGDGDTLAQTSLTVVGTVSSSAYPYTVSFGSTTLGSGTIDQYLYVADGTFSEDTPYTEAYLLVEGAAELESGSADYEALVDEVSSALEGRADELALARVEDLRDEAQAQVDEAREAYEEERDAAEAELADARAELDAAADEISAGEAALEEGEAELADARSELADARSSAEAELAAAANQLDAAEAELAAQEAELDGRAVEVDEAREAYETGLSALLGALGEQGLEAADLDGAREAILSASSAAEEARARLAEVVAALEAAQEAGAELSEEQLAQLEAARAQIAALDEQIEALATARAQADALAEAAALISSYDEGLAQLADARSQLDAGWDDLAAERASAEAQFASVQAQIGSSAAEVEQARSELASAREEYEEGLASWEEARAEADEQLAEAAAEIDDAQAEVDALEPGELYVLDRTQSEGTATYQVDSERMDTIATVFPFMFFLVAALVSLTTMTRMVEDERGQIGTYKGLGYGRARIAGKYLAYAGVAATTGAVIGVAVLTQVLPYIVTSAYGIIYAVPQLSFPLPVDPVVALSSGGLGVGVTLLATWAAVAASLRETPAQLMQPRAPKAGRRILLERVRPLWGQLSFSWKVTCRNLFRYKKRLLMTVVGISGCTALLLVGLGLHDAIWDIIDGQFGPILHYDTTVSLDDAATSDDVDAVVAELAASGQVDDLAHVRHENLQMGSASSEGTLTLQLIVPEDADDLARAVTLRERVSQDAIELTADAVVLGEKTATRLGVGVGDTVTLYGQDAIGNATGEGCELTVTGVAENYVGSVAYAGEGAWEELADAGVVEDADAPFSTIYASSADDAAFRDELVDALQETGHVSTVVFTDETVEMYRELLSVVDLIVVVLIVSAAALAFIVLYNLTNINIGERVREIATLKVLGFKRGEVYAYVFREIFLLALLGDVLGMVLGTWLEGFVVVTAEVDAVMFGRSIHPLSYLAAFALTLAFSALVMLAMRRKLDRVDMVESLKSVD